MIQEAPRESSGNKQKAARALNLSRRGSLKKMKQLGIRIRDPNAI